MKENNDQKIFIVNFVDRELLATCTIDETKVNLDFNFWEIDEEIYEVYEDVVDYIDDLLEEVA